jgi:Protein of unknown function (DUF5818)
MERVRSDVLLLALAIWSTALFGQQSPSTSSPSGEADSIPHDQVMEQAGALPSARTFEGRIVRSEKEFVLKNAVAHTLYKLDDQNKAGRYQGKSVKVTATMDSVSNTLHVIDISQSTQKRSK